MQAGKSAAIAQKSLKVNHLFRRQLDWLRNVESDMNREIQFVKSANRDAHIWLSSACKTTAWSTTTTNFFR